MGYSITPKGVPLLKQLHLSWVVNTNFLAAFYMPICVLSVSCQTFCHFRSVHHSFRCLQIVRCCSSRRLRWYFTWGSHLSTSVICKRETVIGLTTRIFDNIFDDLVNDILPYCAIRFRQHALAPRTTRTLPRVFRTPWNSRQRGKRQRQR